MKPQSTRASLAPRAAFAALAALLLAGCGEIKNTISPTPGSANHITVVLAGQPNAFYAGIYEAQALGLFKQTDLDVSIVTPAADQDPVTMVHNSAALLGITSEPSLLLHRNEDQPVVSVAAIVHAPLQTIKITSSTGGPSGGAGIGTGTTTTATTTTTKPASSTQTTTTGTNTATTSTTIADPGTPLWSGALQQLLSKPGYPTYNGLVIIARKESIVNDAPLLRRFVQAVARGYRAARNNPAQAITNLIAAVPSLAPQQSLETATLQSALPYIFPAGLKVFGYSKARDWNAFGSWMMANHQISDGNAITDASTNELLPAQGI